MDYDEAQTKDAGILQAHVHCDRMTSMLSKDSNRMWNFRPKINTCNICFLRPSVRRSLELAVQPPSAAYIHTALSIHRAAATMAPRKILVSGATGKQGGAVIKALLANPPSFEYEILALTRKTTSNSAKALASNPKITLIEGDLDGDCEAIFQKAGGVGAVWGVFCVTVPNLKSKVEGLETKQGTALVDAAVENKVKHFVFTSVDRGGNAKSGDDPTYIPHFISKVSYKVQCNVMANAHDSHSTRLKSTSRRNVKVQT